MIQKICTCINKIEKGKFILLLLIRIILAYGFFGPAVIKWKDLNSIAQWFGTIGIPLPFISAYLASATEALGVLLLTVGFATRIITIPLIIIMIVAIKTVHLVNGFEASQNGFEIPLYYIVLLLTLFVFGPGKLSLDYQFIKRMNHK